MIKIHSRDQCSGRPCTFHNPSEHHMRDWKYAIRLDRADKLTERFCPHGIGHPDPDSAAYLKTIHGDGVGVHGCDGCCRPPEAAE